MRRHQQEKNSRPARKENIQFFANVEGNCEEAYLQHLTKLIHPCGNANAVIKCFQERKLQSFRKRMAVLRGDFFFHLWDRESETRETSSNFEKTFAALNSLKKDAHPMKILSGYSHLSFDLWIIFHKKPMNGYLSHVDAYLEHINKSFGFTFQSMKTYKQKENFARVLEKISLNDVKEAIQRAKEIRLHQEQNSTPQMCGKIAVYHTNPDLLIHECIAIILKSCGIPL